MAESGLPTRRVKSPDIWSRYAPLKRAPKVPAANVECEAHADGRRASTERHAERVGRQGNRTGGKANRDARGEPRPTRGVGVPVVDERVDGTDFHVADAGALAVAQGRVTDRARDGRGVVVRSLAVAGRSATAARAEKLVTPRPVRAAAPRLPARSAPVPRCSQASGRNGEAVPASTIRALRLSDSACPMPASAIASALAAGSPS